MRIAISGLGRMGANMARRLRRGGIEVVGLNRTQSVVDELAAEVGVIATTIAPGVATSVVAGVDAAATRSGKKCCYQH